MRIGEKECHKTAIVKFYLVSVVILIVQMKTNVIGIIQELSYVEDGTNVINDMEEQCFCLIF